MTLPALFNVGWAAVQISHMSIVNSLSNSNQKRDKLSNNRNGFTYAANITVLVCALIFFLTVNDKINQFRYLCFLCLAIGTFTSLFYMININEVKLSADAQHFDREYKKATLGEAAADSVLKNRSDSKKKSKDWKAWLKEATFYIHGLVYMLVRIAVNVTMTIQPFYLNLVTGFLATDENPTPIELATVPLLSYIFSMFFSLFI